MIKFAIPEHVVQYFREPAAMGGEARTRKHSAEQLSELGKMGDRPKGSGRKQRSRNRGN
jgi:hypothetical protein